MRGPHNLWRLVRTGATFERTGAMRVVLEALNAPPRLRIAAHVLGWPFKWLGLRGDRKPAAADARADGPWPGLYQIRPDPCDPPRCGGA
jgi:ubiquinone biosynthesis protein